MEIEIPPISANLDVLKLYHKQKVEFHFQQKSDNEFLIFLLDVAMKVITFEANQDSDKLKEAEDVVKDVERPAKIAKQTVSNLSQFKNLNENCNFQRQSEILQRQHEIVRSQVDSFQFPGLPDTVVKPTFISKDPPCRVKIKSSSQSSPVSNSNTSDGEKTMETDDSLATPISESEKVKEENMNTDTPSNPTTPISREFRSRSEAFLPTSVSRHIPFPASEGYQHQIDFHSLSPSKLRDHGLLEQKPRVLEMTKLTSNTIPSMAYMFSDKLATSAESTNDNQSPRTHGIGTLQWASEYKFDGSALHIMNGRNSRKPRTVFTWEQLKQMEETFKQKKYLCTEDRMILAQKLDLTDEQIKVWFQNRRQKWKKGGAKDDDTMEYSQYYDIFSRDGQHSQHETERDENNQRSINIPEHLRIKAEQLQCLSNLQQQQDQLTSQQQLSRLTEQTRIIKSNDIRSEKQADNDEPSLIRKQQLRIAADESLSSITSKGVRNSETAE